MKLLSLAALLSATVALGQPYGQGTLIVLNKSDHNVSYYNLATGEETGVVAVGENPHEVAISPDEKYAVITNYGNNDRPGNSLSVIDNQTKKVVFTHRLDGKLKPHGIVFTGDRQILVTTEGTQSVYKLTILEDEGITKVQTDQDISHMIAYSSATQRCFVANIGSGSVTVIDAMSMEKIRDLKTGDGAEGVEVTPDGSEVWITNRGANTISIIDTRTLAVKQILQSDEFPIRIKFTNDGSKALVSCARAGTVQVFDVSTRESIKSIPIKEQAVAAEEGRLSTTMGEGPLPIGILIHPDDSYAYVANTNADTITILDLETLTIAGRMETRSEPDGLGFVKQ